MNTVGGNGMGGLVIAAKPPLESLGWNVLVLSTMPETLGGNGLWLPRGLL